MTTEPIDAGELIRRIGERLWGERCQAAMSVELELNDITVRRLASGTDSTSSAAKRLTRRKKRKT
jgi:hypothetical protein